MVRNLPPPMCQGPDGKQKLRVRQGLGTRDEAEANRLVGQLNEILADPSMWNPAAKAKANSKYEQQIVAAFYDYVEPEERDGWAERERLIPLPGAERGYAKVQLIGPVGARQDDHCAAANRHRSEDQTISIDFGVRATTADLEIISDEGRFRAVVSFVPRDQVRQYIIDCVIAAIAGHLEGSAPVRIIRRFMEHSEMRFRLSYILGSLKPPKSDEPELSDEDDEETEVVEDARGSDREEGETAGICLRFRTYLGQIEHLAAEAKAKAANELEFDQDRATQQDRDALQECVSDSCRATIFMLLWMRFLTMFKPVLTLSRPNRSSASGMVGLVCGPPNG